jgi:Mg-chelatase subunit ChlD
MTYHVTTTLVQPFTRNRIMIENALNRIPPHGVAPHCLNNVFADAANYMIKASNPAGRRVVIVMSGVTRAYNCYGGPSDAAQAIYESGSVVCGIIPKDCAAKLAG